MELTEHYRGLQGIKEDYRALQGVTTTSERATTNLFYYASHTKLKVISRWGIGKQTLQKERTRCYKL